MLILESLLAIQQHTGIILHCIIISSIIQRMKNSLILTIWHIIKDLFTIQHKYNKTKAGLWL
jgi:hypothetical protein